MSASPATSAKSLRASRAFEKIFKSLFTSAALSGMTSFNVIGIVFADAPSAASSSLSAWNATKLYG